MTELILKNLNEGLQYVIFISLILKERSKKNTDEVHFVRSGGDAKTTDTGYFNKVSIAKNSSDISELRGKFEALEKDNERYHQRVTDAIDKINDVLLALNTTLIKLQTQFEERSHKDV